MSAPTPHRVEHDVVYRNLRQRIIHLDLPPGTRLREQALAAEFGVSRTPIRRVLDRLAFEGLVTLYAGSGAVVSTVDLQQLREVWALRLKIAGLVGHFVRLPASDEILRRLDHCLERLEVIDSTDELAHFYDDFHQIMIDVMSNGPLRAIYDQLYAQTARVFVQLLPSLDLETEVETIRDEVVRSREACTHSSGHRLAEVRAKHMQMLLDRVNQSMSIGLSATNES